jgi:hypothetical protein
MWSAWDCYLTAARDILGLRLKPHGAYKHWEDAARLAGFRVMHPEFCMVCEFPDVLTKDEQNRAHNATGPSHRWMDGSELHHWHGVRVPKHVIEAPQTITMKEIDAEPNSEIRRVMTTRYGYARYIKDSGAEVVHSLPENYFVRGLQGAKLYRKARKDDSDVVMIAVKNSTPEPDGSIKDYMLRVDPRAYGGLASRDCHAAMASTWRNKDGSLYFAKPLDYRPAVES